MPPIGIVLENNIVINSKKLIVYNEDLKDSSVNNNTVSKSEKAVIFKMLKSDLVK